MLLFGLREGWVGARAGMAWGGLGGEGGGEGTHLHVAPGRPGLCLGCLGLRFPLLGRYTPLPRSARAPAAAGQVASGGGNWE